MAELSLEALPVVPFAGDAVSATGKKVVGDNDVSIDGLEAHWT